MGGLKTVLSWTAWPGLFALCILITSYGFTHGNPVLYFNISYVFLILSLFFLERFMPFETEWQRPDGQFFADIAHTLTSKGTVQCLLLSTALIGGAGFLEGDVTQSPFGPVLWPYHWPMAAQAALGVVVGEFPLYWAHRMGHEWKFLWRFHAVHHSVTKLWIVNTGRFHFMDSLLKIVVSTALLVALGAPVEVIKWLGAVTAFIGLMTHCNIDMKFGFMSYIFNTPELHRWHHSKDLREGDKNYCENVMIWDLLFGTFFREIHRRPPVDIGIKDPMPEKFIHQLIWPFLTQRQKERVLVKARVMEPLIQK